MKELILSIILMCITAYCMIQIRCDVKKFEKRIDNIEMRIDSIEKIIDHKI